MFYLESLNIKSNEHVGNLSLSLAFYKTYFLTSDNTTWLTNLYKYFKTREHYLSGRWLVSNNDLSIFNETDFLNYSSQKFSFCDGTLILNENWSGNKLIKFYNRFFSKTDGEFEKIQKVIGLNTLSMNDKIINLNKLDYMKLLICLSLIKNSEHIICNFTDLDINDILAQELSIIAESIQKKLNKTFICFLKNTNSLVKTNLDDKKYWQNNKLLTIGEKRIDRQKFSFKKCAKLFFFQNKFLFWQYLVLLGVTLLLSLIFIISLSLAEIKLIDNSGEQWLFRNKTLLQVFGYIAYFALYVWTIIWMIWTNKTNHRFTKFLITIHENRYLKSILYTVSIWIISLSTGIISFIVAILIMNSYNNINTNQIWYALGLFLYIVYIVVIAICLAVKSNQIIKNVTLKETLIKIFIR